MLLLATAVMFAQTPSIDRGGTVNAATNGAGQPVTAGSLVSIYGSQLASGVALADTVPHSTQLGQTSVTFNNVPAALDFVAGTQINAQVPWNVLPAGTSGSVNVVVTRNGVSSAPDPVVITQFGPEIYATSGHALAFIVTDPNDTARYYAFAAPAGSIQGFRTSPARAGDVLLIYATGVGPVDSPIANGASSSDKLRQTTTTPTILFNGTVPGTVLFAGLAPDFPGVYQLNVRVPAGLPGNSATRLQVQNGGITSSLNGGTIAVQ